LAETTQLLVEAAKPSVEADQPFLVVEQKILEATLWWVGVQHSVKAARHLVEAARSSEGGTQHLVEGSQLALEAV
jgi:hypothetical protein